MVNTAVVLAAAQGQNGTRRLWYLSLIASIATVVVFFAAVNIINGRNGLPLGYDAYNYIAEIKQVLAIGPLQFAQDQKFVEVLYPILGSVAVRWGVSADQFEIYFPIILAVASVGAVAYLARQFKDYRVGILSVAFGAGWFAIYRMGAGFHAQLLAFPLLLVATGLLLRIRETTHFARDVTLFVVLVGLAALAHIETTAIFVVVWLLTFLVFGVRSAAGRRRLLIMVAVSLLLTVPALPAVFARYPTILSCGASCRPYPVLPEFWLEALGPEVALVAIGLMVCASRLRNQEGDMLTKLTFVWSLVTIVVGLMGYLFPWFDIVLSDRTLFMIPVPLLSAEATVWIGDQGGAFSRHRNLMVILVLVIPALTALAIFAYLVPQRFIYYPQYLP